MGLRELAQECGIATSHIDGLGRNIDASDASMLAVLRALGVSIGAATDADSIRESLAQEPTKLVQSCLATRADAATNLKLCGDFGQSFAVTLTLESGESREIEGVFPVADAGQSPPQAHSQALVPLGNLPVGYHQARVHSGGKQSTCYLLAAPAKAHGAPGSQKTWGLFAPLYALRGKRDYGVGDFACLSALMDWTTDLGGSFVGTLPLLAANYREDFQTSPYSPVSRLYWNELYLDLQELAERFPSAALSTMQESDEFQREVSSLSELPLVDYEATSRLRRRILGCIATTAWQHEGEALGALADEEPELHRYCCFRATTEKQECTWPQWEAKAASGVLSASDYDEEVYRYHLFCQWAVEQQLSSLAKKECDLYLDLSVGVSGSSFDVWRYQDQFASGVDVGAPPDGLFEGGQNWALPPLHPQRSREQGHEYFARCVRAHMRHAGMLRVDHVMGLHRLYWVPSDLSASEGLYVSYPAEELYAVLLIESQRQQCALVGEDLGTVPDEVRPAMERAGIHRLYVGQFSTEWRPEQQFLGLQEPAASSVASLDTHDTQTFAGWFAGTDLSIDPEDLMRVWTEELAAGPAASVVITLEDLWLEVEPQNRPGTGPEEPNWRHRIERSLHEVMEDPKLTGWLRRVSALREQAQNQ